LWDFFNCFLFILLFRFLRDRVTVGWLRLHGKTRVPAASLEESRVFLATLNVEVKCEDTERHLSWITC